MPRAEKFHWHISALSTTKKTLCSGLHLWNSRGARNRAECPHFDTCLECRLMEEPEIGCIVTFAGEYRMNTNKKILTVWWMIFIIYIVNFCL